jgi:hypothetical protein
MTDARGQAASLSRRRLLGLLGATGTVSGSFGSTASASESPADELSVDLFAFVDRNCLGEDCPTADYAVPVGTEVDFGAYVTGSYDKAASVLVDQDSREPTLLEGCPAGTSVAECREFTAAFDAAGTYTIQYLAGAPESGPLLASDALDVGHEDDADPVEPDCESTPGIACDTVTIAAVEPTVDLQVTKLGESGPVRTEDTLVVETALDPRFEPDDWTLDTQGVPTESAAIPAIDVPPGVTRWGTRPLGPGTLELTATATLGEVTVSATTDRSVESLSGLTVVDPTLTIEQTALSGTVALDNETDTTRSVTVSLLARSDETDTVLDRRTVSLRSGEGTTIALSGTTGDPAETAVLVLDDEVLARQPLGAGE